MGTQHANTDALSHQYSAGLKLRGKQYGEDGTSQKNHQRPPSHLRWPEPPNQRRQGHGPHKGRVVESSMAGSHIESKSLRV